MQAHVTGSPAATSASTLRSYKGLTWISRQDWSTCAQGRHTDCILTILKGCLWNFNLSSRLDVDFGSLMGIDTSTFCPNISHLSWSSNKNRISTYKENIKYSRSSETLFSYQNQYKLMYVHDQLLNN